MTLPIHTVRSDSFRSAEPKAGNGHVHPTIAGILNAFAPKNGNIVPLDEKGIDVRGRSRLAAAIIAGPEEFDPAWVAERIAGLTPGYHCTLMPTAVVLRACADGVAAGTLTVIPEHGRLRIGRKASQPKYAGKSMVLHPCPECGSATRVEPAGTTEGANGIGTVTLDKGGRYCPDCEWTEPSQK